MKKFGSILLVALLCDLFVVLEAKAWQLHTSTDKMSGEVTNYIISYSNNLLDSFRNGGKIMIGYQCGGNLYLRANNLGFHVDDVDCGSYGCLRIQYVRIKFDSDPPENVQFYVWKDNRDGMSLIEHSLYSSRNDKVFMMQRMKLSKTLLVEVQLSNSKGEEKIAEFDLKGFRISLLHCDE